MSKYLYMVNPRIPLKLNGEVIRRSKNLELDIDEVKYALKHGPVHRKFNAQTMERVTLQNIEQLHVEKMNETPTIVTDDIFQEEDTKQQQVEQPENISDSLTGLVGLQIQGEENINIDSPENLKVDVITDDGSEETPAIIMSEEYPETLQVPVDLEGNQDVSIDVEQKVEEVVTDEVQFETEQEQPVEQQVPNNNKYTNNQYQRNNQYRKKRKNR